MGARTVRMPLGQHGGERDDAAVAPTRPHLESRRQRAAREPTVSSGFKVVALGERSQSPPALWPGDTSGHDEPTLCLVCRTGPHWHGPYGVGKASPRRCSR
jgi:hypothetical protein